MPSPSFFRPNKSSRPVLFLARSWGGPQRTNGKPRVFRSNTFLVSSILCSFCFRVFFHRGGGGVLFLFPFFAEKKRWAFKVCGCFLLCWEAKTRYLKRKTTNPYTHTHHHPEHPKTRVEFFRFCPLEFFFWRNQALRLRFRRIWKRPTWRCADFSEKRGFFDRDFGGALREGTTWNLKTNMDDCWEIRMRKSCISLWKMGMFQSHLSFPGM